jgi:hypothetical protein
VTDEVGLISRSPRKVRMALGDDHRVYEDRKRPAAATSC